MQVTRLERVRDATEHALREAQLKLGLHALLVPELQSLSELDPFNEDMQAQLMVALYRSGRQADALGTFRLLRGRLRGRADRILIV